MAIRLLSPNLINQIAAGEVIERPSSAIKELVENAIDAGADSIEIMIREGGKSLISIADNGKGMSAEELALAVERHATSKLPDDDLFNIKTLGFRGEALPSIGSISRLCIASKARGENDAWQINVDGGAKSEVEPASIPVGTKIEVRDLFYATPARLKFLKTNSTETSHIIEVLNRLAMSHPHVQFKFSDERREIFHYQRYEDDKAWLKRVASVMGSEFQENALKVFTEKAGLIVEGYAGLPTLNRANGNFQFLFVNGRPVKDKILNASVRIAYQDFLAQNRFPYVALFLTLDPNDVDMNVHPAKTEVRFREPGNVRNLIISALKTTLSTAGHRASTTVAAQALGMAQAEQTSFTQESLRVAPQPLTGVGHASQNTAHQGLGNSDVFAFSTTRPTRAPSSFSQSSRNHQSASAGFKERRNLAFNNAIMDAKMPETQDSEAISTHHPLGNAKAQLHDTYIVAENEKGIVIVDQHAVHERIVYERMKEQFYASGIENQLLLVPEVIALQEKEIKALETHKESLAKFGFGFDAYGKESIVVREVPAMLGNIDVHSFVKDMVDSIDELGEATLIQEKIEEILATMACHGSIRAGRKLNTVEMNEMLRQMENTAYSGQCNHGRPTYVELKKGDIEKLFGRT